MIELPLIAISFAVMTFLGALAGFCLKRASSSERGEKIIRNPWLYYGIGIYFITALINIYILKIMPYSIVMPLTSITYIWSMLLARRLLGERITASKIAGTLLIAAGAVLIACSL